MLSWSDFQMLADAGKFQYSANINSPPAGFSFSNETLARPAFAKRLLTGAANPEQGIPSEFLPAPRYYHRAKAWLELPLLVQAGENAEIYPVLLGLLPNGQNLIEKGWLSPESEQAAHEVLQMFNASFTLIRRGPAKLISGASFTLPLAVGCQLLLENRPWPQLVAMTGALDASGQVNKVGHIRKKYDCALWNFAKSQASPIFIYPEANRGEAQYCQGAIPVTGWQAAQAIALLAEHMAETGLAGRLGAWRRNPEEFFAWLNSASYSQKALPTLLTLAERENWPSALIAPGQLNAAAEHLCRWKLKKNPPNALVARLIEFFAPEKTPGMDQEILRHLASLASTCANHQGIVNSQWHEISRQQLAQLAPSDPEAEADALLGPIRNQIISAWHNAYKFHEALPRDWLQNVEKRANFYASANYRHDEALGKIYGALTQHAAFAGDLTEAKRCAHLSLNFFKNPLAKKRRLLDLAYLACEQNNLSEAKAYFLAALRHELPPSSELPASLPTASQLQESSDLLYAQDLTALAAKSQDQYCHALWLRICRLSPPLFTAYPVAAIFQDQALSQPGHPWQCWAVNCAALLPASQADLAKKLLQFALRLCLLAPGQTLLPMALPALAILRDLDPVNSQTLRPTLRKILHKLNAPTCELNRAHFSGLLALQNNELAALNYVKQNLSFLFPFNYR